LTDPKSAGAFRTIGELSAELGLPQHILRYWETRFPQLRPLTRAGNRRYYRPDDVALVRRIDQALNRDGYTIKGVQGLLKSGGAAPVAVPVPAPSPDIVPALIRIRDDLKAALAD
jgi:DNA-binding transcriptional MerR regulator